MARVVVNHRWFSAARTNDVAALRGEYAMHPDWIDVRDNWGGSTALIEAAASSHCPNSEVVDFLLGVGADVGVMDDLGNQALHHAAMRGHVTIIQTLLDAGADPEAIGSHGMSVMHRVLAGDNRDAVAVVRAALDMKKASRWMRRNEVPVVQVTRLWTWQSHCLLEPDAKHAVFTVLGVAARLRLDARIDAALPDELWLRVVSCLPRADVGKPSRRRWKDCGSEKRCVAQWYFDEADYCGAAEQRRRGAQRGRGARKKKGIRYDPSCLQPRGGSALLKAAAHAVRLGRKCVACGEPRAKSEFSKTQWCKGKDKSRCTACAAARGARANEARLTATPASTVLFSA